MFECDVAAAGIEPRKMFYGCDANVSANRVKRGVPCDRASGDVPSAGSRDQIAGHVFHGDVSAVGIQARGAADVSCEDVAARGGESDAAVDVFRLDVAATRRNFEVVILGNVDFDGDPEP